MAIAGGGGKAARAKGLNFERQVAIWLRHIFPHARRQLEFHVQDALGTDLMHTGRYRIQCKKFARYAPITKIQEVVCERAKGHVPVLITAGDTMEPLAVIPLKEFLRLVALGVLVDGE